MSIRTTERHVGRFVLRSLAAVGFLAACGSTDADGRASFGPEVVGTTEEAYDASSDKPPAAVVLSPEGGDLIVAINSAGEFVTTTIMPGATTAHWSKKDAGFWGVPTIARFDDNAVIAYASGTDGKIYEYFRGPNDSSFTAQGPIMVGGSPVTGITGSPTVVEVRSDTAWYASSIAVTQGGYLVVLDDTDTIGGGWTIHSVLGQSTPNSITGIPRPLKGTRRDPIFGVRGWNGDDGQGWFATRPAQQFGAPYTLLNNTTFAADGNPSPTRVQTAYVNVGSQILFQYDIYKTTWNVASGCKAGGSIGETGWFRDSHGHLMHLDDVSKTCTEETDSMGVASKPIMAIGTLTNFVYFKGTDGVLWAHQWGTSQHFSTRMVVSN